MRLTVDEYHVEHMDCSAEEQMVRLALEPIPEVVRLDFDLGERRLFLSQNTLRVKHGNGLCSERVPGEVCS